MAPLKNFGLMIILGALLLLSGSFYTVSQTQRGIVLRLGDIVKDGSDQPKLFTPGLHFKLPVIDTVRRIDQRIQTLAVQSSRVLTKRQKFLIVDYYAKWKVANPALFFIRTGGSALRSETLLQQFINNDLRAEFGRHPLNEVISGERSGIMQQLRTQADEKARGLGIQVIDVRIKRIDLPDKVNESVFERMRSIRQVLAKERRSTGEANAEAIRATARADAEVLRANAVTAAAQVRAEGTRIAAKIYTDAYGKDIEFYSFYQSLEAYKTVFKDKKDVLVLSPESQFFKYFNAAGAKS